MTGAASGFFAGRHRAKEELLGRLVSHVLGIEPGDPDGNFDIALEFATGNVDVHSFPEPHPTDVGRACDALQERFGINAQLDKQKHLNALYKRLTAIPRDDVDTRDVQHKIIHMLLCLSRSPLQADYVASGLPYVLAGKAPPAPQEAASTPVDEDALSEVSERCESASDLSSWGDEDSEGEDVYEPPPEAGEAPPAPPEEPCIAWSHLADLIPEEKGGAGAAGGGERAAAGGVAGAGPLARLLEGRQGGALPFAAPQPRQCTSEAALVRQVLLLLRGTVGPAFLLDAALGSFVPAPHAHVSHLSQGALHGLLGRFCEPATQAFRVDRFVGYVIAEGGAQGDPACRATAPTMTALATAVAQRLRVLREGLAHLEAQAAAGQGSGLTLLRLTREVRHFASGVALLEQVVEVAVPEGYYQGDMPHAAVAAHVLDAIPRIMEPHALLRGAAGEEDGYRSLLMVLVATCRPHLEALDRWIYEGELDDPHEEFFIHRDPSVHVGSALFWHKGHSLRPSAGGDGGVPAAPELSVGGLVADVFAAGKSLLLLHHIPPNAGELERDVEAARTTLPEAPALTRRATGRAPLYQRVLRSLVKALGGEAAGQATGWAVGQAGGGGVPLGEGSAGKTPARTPGRTPGRKTVAGRLLVVGNGGAATPGTEGAGAAAGVPHERATAEKYAATKFWGTPGDDGGGGGGEEEEEEAGGGGAVSVSLGVEAEGIRLLGGDLLSDAGVEMPYIMSSVGGGGDPGGRAGGALGLAAFCNTGGAKAAYLRVAPLASAPAGGRSSSAGGDGGGGGGGGALAALDQLLGEYPPELPPPPAALLRQCVRAHVSRQVGRVGRELLERLMGPWRLREELEALRTLFLLGEAELLAPFTSSLFEKLDAGVHWEDYYELNFLLQETLPAEGSIDAKFPPDAVAVEPAPSEAGSAPASSLVRYGIDSLDGLHFQYKLPWPLEMIIDNSMLYKYNQVMCFLLKVKRAKRAIDSARSACWKGRGGGHLQVVGGALLQAELVHFVNTLHQYCCDRVLHGAWQELHEGLESAKSLDQVRAHHESFLDSIQRQCFVAPDKLWVLIHGRMRALLGMVLEYCALARALRPPEPPGDEDEAEATALPPAARAKLEAEVKHLEGDWRECSGFLLRVLASKLRVGHHPHLEDLMQRLNYNGFYMEEDGEGTGGNASAPASHSAVAGGAAEPIRGAAGYL